MCCLIGAANNKNLNDQRPAGFLGFSVCIKIYQAAAPYFKALIVPKQNVCQTQFLIKRKT